MKGPSVSTASAIASVLRIVVALPWSARPPAKTQPPAARMSALTTARSAMTRERSTCSGGGPSGENRLIRYVFMVVSSCRPGRLVPDAPSVRPSPTTRTAAPRIDRFRTPLSAARPVLDEPDEVALGVDDERHPLVGAGRAEGAVVVSEDEVRLAAHLYPGRAQPLDGGVGGVDPQVVQRARRSAGGPQPPPAEVEEDEAGRVERRERFGSEQVTVEGGGPAEVVGALRHLHERHARTLTPGPDLRRENPRTPDGRGRSCATTPPGGASTDPCHRRDYTPAARRPVCHSMRSPILDEISCPST